MVHLKSLAAAADIKETIIFPFKGDIVGRPLHREDWLDAVT